MTKVKKPETKIRAVRLPVHIIERIQKVADHEYRTFNDQALKYLEDGLINDGDLKESERRKR